MASKVRVLLLCVRMHTIGHASLHKMTRLRYAQWECRSKSARKVMHGGTGKSRFNTTYLTDSYIDFTLKMESVSKNTIFGLKMMVKSGLEKFILKSLDAGR